MKPATICFPFIGDSIGGSYISSEIVIRQLISRGYNVQVILHETGRFADFLHDREIGYCHLPIHCVDYARRGKLHLLAIFIVANLFSLYRFLRANDVALVHTNDMRIQFLWSLPCLFASVIHVWHQRTVFTTSRLARLLFSQASGTICISEFVKHSLPVQGPKKSCVIPNPLSPMLPSPEAIETCRQQLEEDIGEFHPTKIIGWFNTLRQLKRPDVFAEAIVKLHDQYSGRIVALIFGEDRGDWERKLRDVLPQQSDRLQVMFKGFCSDPQPWMAICDVIVSTSTEDGFGRTLVEAMQLGIPVVAADAGGHKEIIEHGVTGLLVPPGDANETAHALNQLITNKPLATDIIRTACSSAENRFSPDHVCGQVENFYHDILRATKTP